MRPILTLLLALAAGPATAADGAKLFADQCASCHSLTGASTDSGPSLKGVVWRKLAAAPDFTYSGALKSLGGSWSPSRLEDYLKDAQALAPGTTMFLVVGDPADRKAIVGYLKAAR